MKPGPKLRFGWPGEANDRSLPCFRRSRQCTRAHSDLAVDVAVTLGALQAPPHAGRALREPFLLCDGSAARIPRLPCP